MKAIDITELDPDIETSFVTFSEERLSFRLHWWQAACLAWFDNLSLKLVQGSLATPNGSGKSSVVIPSIVFGGLTLYPKCRIVLLSADAKQLDGQLMPAINAHRGKFPDFRFVEREITTPEGGRFVGFTTDEPGRAEGWHKLDDIEGPLLIICDEAKTIPDAIFQALDRCTFNALLLCSSPGGMQGRFYESQFGRQDFLKLRVGLSDCPHIGQDKIARLREQYGPDGVTPNPSFLASTLDGKFMEADQELRFNPVGLKRLNDMADTYEREWRQAIKTKPQLSPIGDLQENARGISWHADHQTGWLWMCEKPVPGCEYLGFGDPMTGEQSEGSKLRDTHAFGIFRKSFIDEHGVQRDDEIVACLHAENGVRWDNDIAAERFDMLLRFYGDCRAIIEANNSGTEVMRMLRIAGRTLWKRRKRDAVNPNAKLLEIVGFQTTAASKGQWIGALGRAIREETIVCRYRQACSHFSTFILTEDGSGEAQPHAFDDWVTGIGMAILERESCDAMPEADIFSQQPTRTLGAWS
jgi:hypothetical protein